MIILVNGLPREVPEGSRLDALAPARPGVAAAVNGVVVPADRWASTTMVEGDAVEVVSAFQGG